MSSASKGTSLITMGSSVLGKFSRDVVSFADSPVAGVVYIVFSIMMSFVLYDMFIAVIIDAYETIDDDPSLAPYDDELMSHIGEKWKGWMNSVFSSRGIGMSDILDSHGQVCMERLYYHHNKFKFLILQQLII